MTDKGHQPRLCRRHGRVRGVPFESIWLASNKEIQDLPPETDRVDADFGSRFEDESEALGQNSRHAVEFERTCSTYPCERVYEQVVFVGTSSFTMDCYEFIDNVNVSALDASGADFVQVIEKCCADLDDLISQERVSEIGEQLLASYGDLNQQRARLHARRIKGLRESV